ncbi:ferredoxin [Rhodococcus sp. ACS1]|uniref:ferredoxin n=1 Tax=Rhodococcus sp. ACS1 TaxID=2028570 RepID=UPI000BB11420|nr:ferredoxin [Rhodococcus sp. ACS1]PBC35627.1 ferredoxin [Rhodococcus sp. ACS1]
MYVAVEIDKCTACGACVLEAPDVFDQDDEGIVIVLDRNPPEDLREQTEDAADACPSAVIEVRD